MSLYNDMAAELAGIRAEAHGCVGDRPYRATVVVVGWSGGAPGRGQRQELRRTEIGCGRDCAGQVVPAKTLIEGAWSASMHGWVEQGRAILEELDPTYTETQLVTYGRQSPGEESWVELVQDERGGDASDRPVRRYLIDGPPFLSMKPYGWVLRLRSHEPQGVWLPLQAATGGA